MLLFVSFTSAISTTTSNHIKPTTIAKKIELLWGLSLIYITVKEIFGEIDNPQYRPLPDVEVTAIGGFPGILGGIFNKTTGEDGECLFYTMGPGVYLIKASKEGYTDISSGIKRFRILKVNPAQVYYFTFTLTEDGSLFVKQSRQTRQQCDSSIAQIQSQSAQQNQEDAQKSVIANIINDQSNKFIGSDKIESMEKIKDTQPLIRLTEFSLFIGIIKNLSKVIYKGVLNYKFDIVNVKIYTLTLGFLIPLFSRDHIEDRSGFHIEKAKFKGKINEFFIFGICYYRGELP